MNKSDTKTKKFLLITFLLFLSFLFSGNVKQILAVECEDYACSAIENDDERATCFSKRISCLENKISENEKRQDTLENAIANIGLQKKLIESQIEKIRSDIVRGKKEIEVLSSRIENLSASMEKLAGILTQLIASSYKAEHISDLEMYLKTKNFNEALQKKQQQEIVSIQTSKLLFKAMNEKLDFDQKKEKKKKLQTVLENNIEKEKEKKISLEAKEAETTILLSQTKNDGEIYKKLRAEAIKEQDSFKNFAASAGGGSCLGSSPGEGSNGWYFSQRDPRWCRQYVGGSSLTVGEVGCYLTSVTMVHKKYGSSTSPSLMAANRNYFFSNTALMLTPPAPSGYTYKRYDYFKTDIIDNELNAGRPVIVHVRLNNGYGGHFVVLFSGSGGSYTMHDPWYGADLNFSSHYSTGMIDSLRVFTK